MNLRCWKNELNAEHRVCSHKGGDSRTQSAVGREIIGGREDGDAADELVEE